MNESKFTFYMGLTFLVLGIIGVGSIVEKQGLCDNIVTADRFAIVSGLILLRMSKIYFRDKE
jgi:hypothetical protein